MEKTIIIPVIKNIMFFLLLDNVFLSDFTIKGMDAIINPRNKEFISYMFFSKIEVINNTDNIKPAIHPIPILDKNLKAQADELFKNLGMNTSVALNMFLTQSVREQALPFTPNMISPEPSNELKEALQELDDIEKGKIKVKGYHNINTFIDDMLK